MPNPYPQIVIDFRDTDANPAVRLFGRRLFSDQTTLELLIEFLLVAVSKKKIGGTPFDSLLPPFDLLKNPWTTTLDYAPKSRLNLKLFAFFGASKLDTRHETHRDHLRYLDAQIEHRMVVSDDTSDNVLRTMENLYLGFHGIGAQRTWCAQSFLPISRSLISCESIWKQTKANNITEWLSAVGNFSHNQSVFLARGGEVLYLQLCNALRRSQEEINEWLNDEQLSSYLTLNEKNPRWLYSALIEAISNMLNDAPTTVSRLADFIDHDVDEVTPLETDGSNDAPRWTSCGWCPEETWPESYLFAVEILRICRSKMDLIDRIELLETACSMQVLRTIMKQAMRYTELGDQCHSCILAITDPEGENKTVKQVSKACVQKMLKIIYDSLRNQEIMNKTPKDKFKKLYEEADRRYGHKLFLTLCKRIGFIVPKRGAGMRFVLNNRLLRYLIITLSPGRRITYETFRKSAKAHFGLAFDELSLTQANYWSTGMKTESLGGATDEWLLDMLEEAGALRRLSDSCALVENSAAQDDSEEG